MNELLEPAVSRRSGLMGSFPDALILIRGTGPQGLNPNFFYLTGLTEPSGVLVLSAVGVRVGGGRDSPGPHYFRGRTAHQVLFLPESDPVAAQWGEDARVTCQDTTAEDVGVDSVLPVGQFDARLSTWLQQATRLHYVRASPARVDGPDDDATFIESMRNRFLDVEFRDATPAVAARRVVKDAGEIAAIECAAEITATGFDRILGALQPELMEYRMEAELASAYRSAGADHAFGPIVGAGRNALKLHYTENSSRIESGDLVLVDSGARLHGYGADVTRTLPASGRFSVRQAALYDVVLAAQTAAIDAIRPGVLLGDLHALAWETIEAAGYGSAFIHGIGHHLGIETHDAGDTHQALEAGCVITIEPGIYLADEGIGIRIEDDVAVVPDGCRVLTKAIPKTIEAIEERMARR